MSDLGDLVLLVLVMLGLLVLVLLELLVLVNTLKEVVIWHACYNPPERSEGGFKRKRPKS